MKTSIILMVGFSTLLLLAMLKGTNQREKKHDEMSFEESKKFNGDLL